MKGGETMRNLTENNAIDTTWKSICRIGGVSAFISAVCSLMTIIVGMTFGWEPTTAKEYFSVLQDNRVIGILRMDFPSVINIMQYYFIFFGLYAVFRRIDQGYAVLATALAFVGVSLWLATHSGFSIIALSDQYVASTSDVEKSQLLAAGQAVIASDMWQSTGARMGGVLLQTATVLISTLMLRSKFFSKVIGYLGIVTHGLDLIHIIIGIFNPGIGNILMAIAGPLYLVWFPLVGIRLWQLGRQ